MTLEASVVPSSSPTDRVCSWCRGPIPAGARRDSVFCKTPCRQASHRFHRGAPRREASSGPARRFGYGDPPYPGLAHLYAGHPDYAGEVDHVRLVERLVDEYPDGWALSTSAAALPQVLRLCPEDVRVAAWFRGERPTESYHPLNAWEPVIVRGGRPYKSPVDERRLDALVAHFRQGVRLTDPGRVVGAKPAAFCWWLFDLLGALPGDTIDDLYPGSGGVARAWAYVSSEPGATRRSPATHDASPSGLAVVSAGGHDGSVGDVEHDASCVDRPTEASCDTTVDASCDAAATGSECAT